MTTYQVVLVDAAQTTAEGRVSLEVKLSEVMKMPPEKAKALMKRLPYVVKRGLSQPQAEKYEQVLRRIGAEVRLEAEEEPKPVVESSLAFVQQEEAEKTANELPADGALSFAAPATDNSVSDEPGSEDGSVVSGAIQFSEEGSAPQEEESAETLADLFHFGKAPAGAEGEGDQVLAEQISPPPTESVTVPEEGPVEEETFAPVSVNKRQNVKWLLYVLLGLLFVLGAVSYIFREEIFGIIEPEAGGLSAQQIQALLVRQKKVLLKQKEAPIPAVERSWVAEGKQGGATFKIQVVTSDSKGKSGRVELGTDEPAPLTPQELVRGVKRYWLRRFVCDDLRPSEDGKVLSGSGFAYISEGNNRLRAVAKVTVEVNQVGNSLTGHFVVASGEGKSGQGDVYLTVDDRQQFSIFVEGSISAQLQTANGVTPDVQPTK